MRNYFRGSKKWLKYFFSSKNSTKSGQYTSSPPISLKKRKSIHTFWELSVLDKNDSGEKPKNSSQEPVNDNIPYYPNFSDEIGKKIKHKQTIITHQF